MAALLSTKGFYFSDFRKNRRGIKTRELLFRGCSSPLSIRLTTPPSSALLPAVLCLFMHFLADAENLDSKIQEGLVGFGSVVKSWPSVGEVLCSILHTTKQKPAQAGPSEDSVHALGWYKLSRDRTTAGTGAVPMAE